MSIHTKRLATGRVLYEVKLRDMAGRQYSRSFRTRREAEAFQVTEKAARIQGSWIDFREGKVTFGVYATQWLKQRVALRPRTVDLYDYLFRCYLRPEFEHLELRAITPARVRAWHASLKEKAIGPSTIAKCYRLLRTVMATAVDDELIVRNPCVLKGASTERAAERPIATVAQIATLGDEIDGRYRSLVLLATWTGLRFGELAGLRREDLDVVGGTIRVVRQVQELTTGQLVYGPPKTDAGYRTVAIPPHIVPDLVKHLAGQRDTAGEAPLFPSPDGTPLRRSNFNRRAWQPACAAAGLTGFRFHDLRHTGNTLAAATGASTKELMVRMGHASPRAALIYHTGVESGKGPGHRQCPVAAR